MALNYVLNHTSDYQKPWQSRRVITRLIGEGSASLGHYFHTRLLTTLFTGMLAAEGQVHKRMRRVGTPAFSPQNMKALAPVVYGKAQELKDKWSDLIDSQQALNKISDSSGANEKPTSCNSVRLDACHWISRATFDVIGLAGEDLDFIIGITETLKTNIE